MIAVIGLGYVGLPLAVAMAAAGRPVLGFDRDAEVVAGVSSGSSHILDVPDARLASSLGAGLRFTSSPSDLAACTTFVICVPTPLSLAGQPDLGCIADAVRTIAPHVRAGTLVVLESTSYPGTTEEVVAEPLAALTGLVAGSEFCVAFSPERVDPGNPEFALANTPKVVAGLHDCCRDRAAALYSTVSSTVVEAAGLREAELAKLLENTYRQVNIALMNEMVKFCRALDIDLHEAIRCAATKPFGFQPFYPGPGVGGHCIPIDPRYLASRVADRLGYSFRFVELAQEINSGMPAYVVDRLGAELALRAESVVGARVLVLGVTYKRDVPDMRQSPAEAVVRLLRSSGARVSFHDPFIAEWSVDGEPVPGVRDLDDVPGAFDASVLVTDHAAYSGLDASRLAPLCLDTRGRLQGDGVVGL